MDILQLAASTVPISQSAEYSCVATNKWSGANHPIDYNSVSGNAHWSPPVLLAHSKFADLWSPGDMASPGIEMVAETGSTSTLRNEIEVLQTKGLAGDMVIGSSQFNAVDPPQIFETITLSPSFPYLSTISMMAPSPDWFSGFESFSPRGQGGFWFKSFEIATYPFDAGTEMGDTYSINNDSESPHEPIVPLTKDTVPDSGILLDPSGTTVLPVMTWKCTLKDNEEMYDMAKPADMMKEDSSMSEMMKEDSSMSEEPFRSQSRISTKSDKSGDLNMLNGGFRGLRGNSN